MRLGKLVLISAFAIMVVFARVEMANAYYQQLDASQQVDSGGKNSSEDKGGPWAPGFGPNGVVASVETAPSTGASTGTSGAAAANGAADGNTAVAGVHSAPQTGTQSGSAVAGVSNLPSTNTNDTSGLLGLGAALMAFGAFLIRNPTKSRD
jgi:LPXTG-motif cell wall-anchored protein